MLRHEMRCFLHTHPTLHDCLHHADHFGRLILHSVIYHVHISRGPSHLCQLGGFSGVGAIVASFLPTECSGGMGMWGIFGKPLKRAIWNTPGLHAVQTICLRFSSFFGQCLCCLLPLFVNRQPPCLHTNSGTPCCIPRCTTKASGTEKGMLWRCNLGAGYSPEVLQPYPGFVWVKSGYSEAIAWRKVWMTNIEIWTSQLPACGPCLSTRGGTQAAGLGKVEEICSHSRAGGLLRQWGPSPCGEGQR